MYKMFPLSFRHRACRLSIRCKSPYPASGVSLMETLIYFSLFSIISLAMKSIQGMLLSTGSDMRDPAQSPLSDETVAAQLSVNIPAASRRDFCQFTPDPALPARFGQNISQIWIQITPTGHEAARDWLSLVEYGQSSVENITENGTTRSRIRYQDISINGRIIWPQITAEFDPATGIMQICTAGSAGCSAAMDIPRSYTAWRKAISRLTYQPRLPPQEPLKRVIISPGIAPSCPENSDGFCGITVRNNNITPPSGHAAIQFDTTDWMNICRVTVSNP